MKEKILKSNIYQIILPMDSTLEKVIDTNRYSIKEFKEEVYLIEEKLESEEDNNK